MPSGADHVFNGGDIGDHAGSSLWISDVDGDLKRDLIIAAPDGDGSENARVNSGDVDIVFGSASLAATIAPNVTIYGGAAGNRTGTDVSTGDISPAARRADLRPIVCLDTISSDEIVYRSMTKKRDPQALLPLTPGMFQVLIALADGEKHGYAIIKEVARRTGGAVTLSAGTLYTIVRRFVQEGVIAESDERPDPALDDERRRYYGLTVFGRDVAKAEAARMETALQMARAKALIPKPRPT